MKFSDVVGHSFLKEKLTAAVDAQRISHAQLFLGECGSGSLALALAYAQYLNCTNRHDGDSCGVCPSCVKYEALSHADLHFVYPVNSAAKSSSVEVVSDDFLKQWRELACQTKGYFSERDWYDKIEIDNKQGIISKAEADEILRKLSFKSFEGGYKVMLIWLPENMRVEAANSMLKILEEPWDKTVFILVSANKNKLLSTIISRTQEVYVPGIDTKSLGEHLAKKYSLSFDDAYEYARLSGGNLLEAEKIINSLFQRFEDENFDNFVQLMRLSYNDKHMELLEWAEEIATIGREKQKQFLQNSVRLLRNSYMINASMSSIVYLCAAEKDFCAKFAPFIGNHNIEALVRDMELALSQVVQNGNAKMIFAHFALDVSKKIVKL